MLFGFILPPDGVVPITFMSTEYASHSNTGSFHCTDHWRIQGGARDALPPLDSISSIFMQFSAKISQIIGFWPKLRGWRSHLENPGSATADCICWLNQRRKVLFTHWGIWSLDPPTPTLQCMPPLPHMSPCHAYPPPCMPPAMYGPFHTCPLPCMPPAMNAPYMHAPCHTCPPVDRMTDTCENITFPQLL